MKDQYIRCVDCDLPAEFVDCICIGYDEPLCESCAKDRALDKAENNREIIRIENLAADDFDKLLEVQREEES